MDSKLLDKAVQLSRKQFHLSGAYDLKNCTMKSSSIKINMSNGHISLDITYPTSLVEDLMYASMDAIQPVDEEIGEVEEPEVTLKSRLSNLNIKDLKKLAKELSVTLPKPASKSIIMKKLLSNEDILDDLMKKVVELGGNADGKEAN